MVVETGAAILPGDLAVAGAVRKEPPDQLEALRDGLRRGKGTKVAAPIGYHLPHQNHPREILLHGDLDIGIALVILEADVVARVVSLDELGFEDEGLKLALGDDPLDIRDVGDQAGGLGVAQGRLAKVGTHPMAQHQRLAHIDDATVGVAHQVDARLVRKAG